MKKNAVLLTLLILSFNTMLCYAQKKSMKDRYDYRVNLFQAGYTSFSSSNLKAFLPTYTSDPLNNDYLVLGFSSYGAKNKFIAGGSFEIMSNKSKNDPSNSFKSSMTNLAFLFDFGYDFLNNERIKLFPIVGVGLNGSLLNITNNQSLTAAQVGLSPGNEINLFKINAIFDFGLGLDFNYRRKEPTDPCLGKTTAFTIGLRAGYYLSVDSKNWRYSGAKITDGPSYGPSGFYAKLVLGMATFYK